MNHATRTAGKAGANARADAALCASISVPFPQIIGPGDLIEAISAAGSADDRAAVRWAPHIERLFTETPLSMVLTFFDRRLSTHRLRRAYAWHRARGGPPNPELEEYLASISERSEHVD